MWCLYASEKGGPFTPVDSFQTVTDAARKIVEIERESAPDLPSGVFFQVLIETAAYANETTEREAFEHLEYSAAKSGRLYVVKRIRH